MRNKLIEIITNEMYKQNDISLQECSEVLCNAVEYLGEKIADALLRSKVIKPEGKWITSYMGCVINCSNCGERLELCYPDGTEVRVLPYCPYCGAKMEEN